MSISGLTNPSSITEKSKSLRRPGWHRVVPAALLVILLMFGIGAYLMERSNLDVTQWVDHSYEVRLAVSRLRGRLYEAESSRSLYLITGSQTAWNSLQQSMTLIPQYMDSIKSLVSDNAAQLARAQALEPDVNLVINELPAPANVGPLSAAARTRDLDSSERLLTAQVRASTALDAMRDAEEALLQLRQTSRRRQYEQMFLIVGLIFFATVLLLGFYFRMMLDEIRLSREAERQLRDSAVSFRMLSAKVLELQDRERRRVARELHDSVGQYLAVLRMNLGQMNPGKESSPQVANLLPEALDLTDKAIGEVRTISYLLHPPMLEHAGLDGAVRWYSEGFAKRSGLKVEIDVPDLDERLPKELELALFRVLQESLTNVHRHAGAQSVKIDLHRRDEHVTLTIKDDGKGLSKEAMNRFRAGLAGGVGLAGMLERLTELDGTLEVESGPGGTTLRATVPMHPTTLVHATSDGLDELD
jgi:signal transduction histidine kinase